MRSLIKSKKECVEKLERSKAMPLKTQNHMKNNEFEKEIIAEDICDTLIEEPTKKIL